MDTQLTAALIGPIITGVVTAAGIEIQRRRAERDLEARRLKLIEVARNQIAAVEPVWNQMENNAANTPADTRERAYTIVVSALDSILRAQTMTPPERHSHSIVGELLLFHRLHTLGARILRGLYYISFVWATFWVIVTLEVILQPGDTRLSGRVIAVVLCVSLGLAPPLVIRSSAVSYEHRHAPQMRQSASSEASPPSAHAPSQPSERSVDAPASDIWRAQSPPHAQPRPLPPH